MLIRPWTAHSLHCFPHAPPRPPGAQIHSQPLVSCQRVRASILRVSPTQASNHTKYQALPQRWGAKGPHMLSKQEKERGHQYPPREGRQLLCRQKESNTQKQRLKGE